METLYIVIPAYNEEKNIEKVIDDWYPVIERYNGNGTSRLVVIDDGSRDNTYNILMKCAQDRPLLHPVTKKNSGHGATVLYGYHYALKQGADYIFQTDSDGQTRAEEFHQFWKLRKQYDMVIGLRNKRQDGITRIFVTGILKIVVRLCFKVRVPDANTPYRLMDRKSLSEALRSVPAGFNLSNVLIAVIYAKRKKRVKYIPITFMPRQGGTNSINIRSIIRIGRKALYDFRKLNKQI